MTALSTGPQSTPPDDASRKQLGPPGSSLDIPTTQNPAPSPSVDASSAHSGPPLGASPSSLTAPNASAVSGDSAPTGIGGQAGSASENTSAGGTPSGSAPVEHPDSIDEEDEVEGNDAGKKARGKPSHFSGARLEFMEEGLKRYMNLNTKKEKIQFWPVFMPELMEKFPLSQYPIPRSRLSSRETFEEKSPEDVKKMTREEKNTYQRGLRRANATDEELYLQMAKDWMGWKQNTARKSDGGMTGALFKAELEKRKKQVKPQFNHFVMKHPEYKENVVNRSSETGRLDRLPSRAQAVKDLLEELSADEVESLKEEYNELVAGLDEDEDDQDVAPPDLAVQRGRRKNFGSLAQDVLNIWRKLTGLNLVLLAGECIDGDADYDSCVIFSKPEGCPDMDEGEGVDFDRFSNTFLQWLKDVYMKTHPDPKNSQQSSSAPSASSATSIPSTQPKSSLAADANRTSNQQAEPGNQGKRRARPDKKKAGRADEGSMSEEETTEPSEPSDMGSGSEGEQEGVQERPSQKKPAPINSEGLWEKNDEGLPVLKVAMCELTREQQAAFTRECATAIGLTKALEELEDDMRKSGKGKKPSVSRYKGLKPSRRSSRIQPAEMDHDVGAGDGNLADSEMEDDGGVQRLGSEEIRRNARAKTPAEKGDKVSDGSTKRIIHSIDNVEILPAWARAVVNGYAHLDTPQMETWARFDVNGCSTPFLKDYSNWLLGPDGVRRPDLWSVVVYKWIEVEEEWNKRGVSNQGPQFKMLKNRRPKGFLQWFKYGRLRWEELVPPEVVSSETLAHEWWIWWTRVVNPRWRPTSEDMVMPGGNGSWEAVRIPGKDGFILVLVALRWWCDLLDHPESDVLWVSTVKAVHWTLTELLKDAQSLQDGSGSDNDDDQEQIEDGDQEKACGDKRKRNVNVAGRERKRRR